MVVNGIINDIIDVCHDGYRFVFWHRVGSDARSGGSARDSARDRDRVSDWISEFV